MVLFAIYFQQSLTKVNFNPLVLNRVSTVFASLFKIPYGYQDPASTLHFLPNFSSSNSVGSFKLLRPERETLMKAKAYEGNPFLKIGLVVSRSNLNFVSDG